MVVMRCPNDCDTALVMSERAGIEIDYCPTCRGVWLDRGELDKIIERNATNQPPAMATTAMSPAGQPREPDRPGRDGYPPKKKKRASFLEDLFEF
jgi:Zn-finger nucleic acid-binding protein